MNRLFSDLLPEARGRGLGLAELSRHTQCGDRCGLCRPYLRRMLATGETVFHHLIAEDSE